MTACCITAYPVIAVLTLHYLLFYRIIHTVFSRLHVCQGGFFTFESASEGSFSPFGKNTRKCNNLR